MKRADNRAHYDWLESMGEDMTNYVIEGESKSTEPEPPKTAAELAALTAASKHTSSLNNWKITDLTLEVAQPMFSANKLKQLSDFAAGLKTKTVDEIMTNSLKPGQRYVGSHHDAASIRKRLDRMRLNEIR